MIWDTACDVEMRSFETMSVFSSKGMQPQHSNCKERGLKCLSFAFRLQTSLLPSSMHTQLPSYSDEFAEVRAIKLLRHDASNRSSGPIFFCVQFSQLAMAHERQKKCWRTVGSASMRCMSNTKCCGVMSRNKMSRRQGSATAEA